MNPYDRHRLLAALTMLVMALFVTSGTAYGGRWRPQMRVAAIVLFGVAVAAALVEIGLWLVAAAP